MRIMIVTSEAAPLAKTGGLADMASGLSNALANAGHDVTLVMPCYWRFIAEVDRGKSVGSVSVNFPTTTINASILETKLPGSDVRVLMVDCPRFFDRQALYVESGVDYRDNAMRFMFFSRAAVEIARSIREVDVIHANDWQSALIPGLILQERDLGSEVGQVGTVMTLHNMAFQGSFPSWHMDNTGLHSRFFNWQQLEFYGELNLLKGGIAMADMVTTVSPTYAKEICTPEFGYGLETILESRRDHLVGILNGVDMNVWNPKVDTLIAANYDVDTFEDGKRRCKAALQSQLGLPQNPDSMVLGMVSRLTDQKGLDLLTQKAGQLLGADVQFAILGTGDARYENHFRELQQTVPDKVAAYIGFDEGLAHRIEAGSDAYLMPSRFEPCGLNQQYSLVYGTPPIVNSVGGLADSVVDTSAQTLADGTATGFKFHEYSGDAFLDTVWRAVGLYVHHRDDWLRVVQNGMNRDSSWAASAANYLEVYKRAIAIAN